MRLVNEATQVDRGRSRPDRADNSEQERHGERGGE
jgi:hypothetical protein